MEQWISTGKAIKKYGLPRQTLYAWIRRRKIESRKVENKIKVNENEIQNRVGRPPKQEEKKEPEKIQIKEKLQIHRAKQGQKKEVQKKVKKEDPKETKQETKLKIYRAMQEKSEEDELDRATLEKILLEEKIAKIKRENRVGDKQLIDKNKTFNNFGNVLTLMINAHKEMLEKWKIQYNLSNKNLKEMKNDYNLVYQKTLRKVKEIVEF